MLVEKLESVNGEVRETVLLALSRECGPLERERWIRGNESCKLTI